MSSARFGLAMPGAAPPPPPAPPRRAAVPPEASRRRRSRIAAVTGASLVAVGGAFWIGWVVSPTPARPHLAGVLETTVALPVGAPVPAGDLRVTTIATPAVPAGALRPADRSRAGTERAARPLPAGTVLTSGDVMTATYPPAGQSLVGVQLSGAEAPAEALAPGVSVEVLLVPAASQPPYPAPQPLTAATVWSSTAAQNGAAVVIDLPAQLASAVAGAAAHDEISLVLTGS